MARQTLEPTAHLALLPLPDDRLPPADAIVSVGHPVSYLASVASRATSYYLIAVAGAG